MKSRRHVPTLRPVRKLRRLLYGNVWMLRDAMVRTNVHWGRSELRHASFDRMLQGMPRPDLERVLAEVRSWRGG